MRSWVFFRSLFYQTLFYSLASSLVAKLIINIAIKPVSSESGLALPGWQTYSSPPGNFAITFRGGYPWKWHQLNGKKIKHVPNQVKQTTPTLCLFDKAIPR
jgi:hypothetical protein|tara:strand:- start:14 stop:316 length:303 start_codon:yes stop_codon:yes gene_type:complete